MLKKLPQKQDVNQKTTAQLANAKIYQGDLVKVQEKKIDLPIEKKQKCC